MNVWFRIEYFNHTYHSYQQQIVEHLYFVSQDNSIFLSLLTEVFIRRNTTFCLFYCTNNIPLLLQVINSSVVCIFKIFPFHRIFSSPAMKSYESRMGRTSRNTAQINGPPPWKRPTYGKRIQRYSDLTWSSTTIKGIFLLSLKPPGWRFISVIFSLRATLFFACKSS